MEKPRTSGLDGSTVVEREATVELCEMTRYNQPESSKASTRDEKKLERKRKRTVVRTVSADGTDVGDASATELLAESLSVSEDGGVVL
jgi:hypothetical protein